MYYAIVKKFMFFRFNSIPHVKENNWRKTILFKIKICEKVLQMKSRAEIGWQFPKDNLSKRILSLRFSWKKHLKCFYFQLQNAYSGFWEGIKFCDPWSKRISNNRFQIIIFKRQVKIKEFFCEEKTGQMGINRLNIDSKKIIRFFCIWQFACLFVIKWISATIVNIENFAVTIANSLTN